MAITRIRKAGLIPAGFQVMSLANSTAVAINSTVQDASVLFISVETTDARMRSDGTDPTNNTGVLFTKALAPYELDGYDGTSILKFCRSGGAGTSTVSIMGYKHAGDV